MSRFPLAVRLQLVWFVLWNALDVLTTQIDLAHGAREVAPLASRLMSLLGAVPAMLLIKLLGLAGVLALTVFLCMNTERRHYASAILSLASLAGAAVIVGNLATLHQMLLSGH